MARTLETSATGGSASSQADTVDPRAWNPRPMVSIGLRALVLLVPLAAGWIWVKSAIALVSRPAGRFAFSMWMAGLIVVSFGASLGVQRIMRQLAPLAMLFNVAATTAPPATPVVAATGGPMKAVDDRVFVPGSKSVSIEVLRNDDFKGLDADPSSLSVSVAPIHGTVEVTGLTLVYTPADGYSGADWIVYSVCSTAGACDAAGVSVTVTS